MFLVLAFIVIALVAGFIADYVWGRKHAYERWELFVVGIVGSFVGGSLFAIIDGKGFEIGISGLLGSIIGAIIFLPVYGFFRERFKKPAPVPASKNTAMKSSSSKKNR
ncbi:MAG: GlsB/YeaQ/YmgE family stress response membrane protein [Chloroflexota bacterium]